LFAPLGMTYATARFDEAGTFVGSSFVYATARDFARFGLLYLRDGRWSSTRVLPEGWVDFARTPAPACETGEYGAHWWLRPDDPWGTFYASGYEGQYTYVVPALDAVVVRLGKTPAELRPGVEAWLDELLAAIASA
jgi:CubicO group peptidase (beta-lactamase class C family)